MEANGLVGSGNGVNRQRTHRWSKASWTHGPNTSPPRRRGWFERHGTRDDAVGERWQQRETTVEALHRTHGSLVELGCSSVFGPDSLVGMLTKDAFRGDSECASGSRGAVDGRAAAGQPAAARRRHSLHGDSPDACGTPTLQSVGGTRQESPRLRPPARRGWGHSSKKREEGPLVSRVSMPTSRVSLATAAREV